jgi:hypothetical protein
LYEKISYIFTLKYHSDILQNLLPKYPPPLFYSTKQYMGIMVMKALILATIVAAAAVGLAVAPLLVNSVSADPKTLCTGPGSSCDPGNTQSDNHNCKATGSGKCVPGQD